MRYFNETRKCEKEYGNCLQGLCEDVRRTTRLGIRIVAVNKTELSRLGFRIRRTRILLGYSQNLFAAKCGLGRVYLREIERGDCDITFGDLCAICEGLTCDIAAVTKDIPSSINSSPPSQHGWYKGINSGSNGQ